MSTTTGDLRKLYIRILKDQAKDPSPETLAISERKDKLQRLKDLNKRTEAVLQNLQAQFQSLLGENRKILLNQGTEVVREDRKDDVLEGEFDAVFASLPNPSLAIAPTPNDHNGNTNGIPQSTTQSPGMAVDTASAVDTSSVLDTDLDLDEDVEMEGDDGSDNDEVGLGSNIDFF